ncbi:MAG: DoxX family protein [Chthoniobacterales bacterium]
MILTSLSKYRDFGLLLLRIGIGGLMIMYGWPKIVGGADMWKHIGEGMQHFGIHFLPTFWGFMCAITETLGGALIVLGFLFRPATILLTINMIVASVVLYHMNNGQLLKSGQPIELAILFASLIFIGAGKFSVDRS